MMPVGPWLLSTALGIAICASVDAKPYAREAILEPRPLDAPGALQIGTFRQHGLERRVALVPRASFERMWLAAAGPRQAESVPTELDGRRWRAAEEGGWRILSRWYGLRLEVLQSRPGEALAIASTVELKAASPTRRLPDWWPDSLRGWQHSAQDGPVHTTTVVARWPGSGAALNDTLRAAAARAGLARVLGARPASGAAASAEAAGAQDGFLMFAGAGSEWTVTVIEHSGRYTVISHFTQMPRPR